jgi:subtilisin
VNAELTRQSLLDHATSYDLGFDRRRAGGPQRYNVGIEPEVPAETVDRIADRAESVRRRIDLDHLGVVVTGRYSPGDRDRLETDPDVKYVEVDGRVEALAQTVPWGIRRIEADLVRPDAGGDGPAVAVLDTGVDDDHPDLPTPAVGKCFVENCCGEATSHNGNDCNYAWSDDNDHGTHATGTVAAIENNEGVLGVGTGLDIMAGKVLDGGGSGLISGVVDGIKWATDNGADVINMSFGTPTDFSAVENACQYAVDNNVVVVAAAGNPGNCYNCDCASGCQDCDVYYPAAYSTVIGVSAVGPDDGLARYSATGPEIGLAAPGGYVCDGAESTSILSTIPPESDGDETSTDDDPGYAYIDGTSMAAPHVTGVAARVKAETSLTDTDAIRTHLQDSAEDIGLSDDEQGHGLVDAGNALRLNHVWSFDAGTRIQHASVAVSATRVIVGGLGSALYGLDRTDGTVEWQVDRAGELADSSPTLEGGTVYVGSGDGLLYALDVTGGTVEWTTSTDSAIVSTPHIVNGIAYVGSNDGTILAVDDANTGAVLWETALQRAVYTRPTVIDGRVVVMTRYGEVVALDSATGDEEWRVDTATGTAHSSPMVGDGRIYVGTDSVYALDPVDGSGIWERAFGGTVGSSPRYDPATDQVFIGSADGTVYALDATDGRIAWTRTTGGPVGSTPTVVDDRVLVGSDDGSLYLFDSSTGRRIASQTPGKSRSVPTVRDDVAYVSTWDGSVVAYSNVTGG